MAWTEADSKLYRELATVAVPARDEQLATLLTLLPFGQDVAFRAVELGCGEGFLSEALLECFPSASIVALDGSAEMRAQATERSRRFGSRVSVAAFDLAASDWLSRLQGFDCLLSSLCLHHLPGREKRRLFAAIAPQLSPRGALLVADLIEPQRPEARDVFAATWDHIAQAQALATHGSTRPFEKFVQERWNHYRFPDPVDQPSPLFDQLMWLREAGFAVVDCFWLQAGHAIYGGYKTRAEPTSPHVTFATAQRTVQAAMGTTSRIV
jgi:tRNA (cmo5U34)-methyltransferase